MADWFTTVMENSFIVFKKTCIRRRIRKEQQIKTNNKKQKICAASTDSVLKTSQQLAFEHRALNRQNRKNKVQKKKLTT